MPDASVRLELWRAALGTSQSTGLDLETLASTYHAGAEVIARAGAAVRAMTLHRAGGAVRAEDVSAALGAQLGADLSSVATRLVVTQTWDDLVLQRALLWRAMLPPEAPVEGKIDHELLARTYQLSGGQIRNVALRAAFLAAAGGEPLSMHWIRLAAERQYLDRGKLLASGELE